MKAVYSSSFSVLKNVSEQNRLDVKNVVQKHKSLNDVIKIIRQSFDYKKLYTYNELTKVIDQTLKEYNFKFNRNDFDKYVNVNAKRVYKDGKKIRLYELIR